MIFLQYFTDPVLKAPMIGSILMCIGASLMGTLAFVRKKSLLAETLAHASYPGLVLATLFFYLMFPGHQEWAFAAALLGAFISAFIGLWAIDRMIRKRRVTSDSSLSFILASFFGLGLLFASWIQIPFSKIYKEIQSYLYGQTATMTDLHVFIYAVLSAVIVLFLLLFYRQIQAMLFHYFYAKSLGIKVQVINIAFFFLLVLSIVIGIRSVGIVLISAMLIAPAVAARQFTHKLSLMLLLSSCFGLLSACLGTYISVEASLWLMASNPEKSITFPTGPMIALVSVGFAFLSLLFAPKRGFIFRMVRIARFKYRTLEENILKSIWKKEKMTFLELKSFHPVKGLFLVLFLFHMKRHGWLVRSGEEYFLTKDGQEKAKRVVRIHRLWELYLADHLGMGVEKVHRSAEEMEHIITPELEEKLSAFLSHPTKDPHAQPIPLKSEIRLDVL